MSKRGLEQTLSKDEIYVTQNPTKRQKINHNVLERKWSAMELYCIMELMMHSDVYKFYNMNPHLDASLFNVQDWDQISNWMTSYFSQSQSFWFANNIKPKIPYNPQEIKKCAMDIISSNNDGILPKKYDKLMIICEKTKKIFNENAIKVLDKNRNAINAKLKQTKIINNNNNNNNKMPPIPFPTLPIPLTSHIKITNNASKSISKPISKPISKQISKPISKPISKQILKPISKPISKPILKSISKLISKPISKQISKQISKATPKAISKCIAKVISKPTSKPLIKPLPKSISKSISKPISKSTPKTTSKAICKPISSSKHKSDDSKCQSYVLEILQKLSQYNDKTHTTMHKKLQDKYNKHFESARQELNGPQLRAEEKNLQQQKDKDWIQYKQTIAEKVKGSWEENVQKLQQKFSNVHSVIPKVYKLYLDKNPNDETIKQLFSSTVKIANPSSY